MLARRYGINQKTVAKWKRWTSVADVPTGRKRPTSTVLSIEEEAVIVAFRLHTQHPWTNGQVERMNRTIKDATVKRFHYDDYEQLRRHLADFVIAYNFGRRLKTLKGLTPYEFICKRSTTEPERFNLNPLHQSPGSNN